MAKCQIKYCDNDVSINKNTGHPHTVCRYHYERILSENTGPKQVTKVRSTVTKPKPEVKKAETFVLRGNTLTINVNNTMNNIPVNRFTRAVIFNNDDAVSTSGEKSGKYILAIKQGSDIVRAVIYKSKKTREKDYATIQRLLSTL
jgi:hypothetical protein